MTNGSIFYTDFNFFGRYIIADLVKKVPKYFRGRYIGMSIGLGQTFILIFCAFYYTWMTNSNVFYIYFKLFGKYISADLVENAPKYIRGRNIEMSFGLDQIF